MARWQKDISELRSNTLIGQVRVALGSNAIALNENEYQASPIHLGLQAPF